MSAASGAPAVSVTVVLHNSEDTLAQCLRSLQPEVESNFAELIVVDNASPDRSVKIVRELLPSTLVLASEHNLGFAAGANLAWPHVRGRYWMLLNPDAVLEPGALRRAVRWMDDNRQIGIGSAELVGPDGGGPPITGRAYPAAWRALLEATRLHLLLPRKWRGRILRGSYWTGGDQLDAGWVPGTAMIVRREVVDAIGPLNPGFFLYGEDVEWCMRAREAGWGIGVCSSAIVRHAESSSAKRTFGGDDVMLRMARGHVKAARTIKGTRYATRDARAVSLSLELEAHHPRRSREHRERTRAVARAWRAALRDGGSADEPVAT